MAYLYLAIAIVAEVIATNALKAADGFSRPLPSIIVVLGYGIAFYCLSLVLRSMPVGIAYAIWAGVGIVLTAIVAALWFAQRPDPAAILGMGLIIAGVVVIQLFSNSTTH